MKWYNEIGTRNDPTKDILKEMRVQKEQEEIEKQEKLKFLEKQRKYAKFVKEMHWPKVSKLKQQEMQSLKSSLEFHKPLNRSTQSQIIKKRVPTNRSEGRHVTNEYVSTASPHALLAPGKNKKDANATSESYLKIPKRKWKENKMIPPPKPKKESIVVDYLLRRRQNREKNDMSEGRRRTPYLDWKNLVTDRSDNRSTHNMSALENYGLDNKKSTIEISTKSNDRIYKLDQIRQAARQIEESANRKEQLIKFQGGSINDSVGVNDLLINAIEAKLKILEDL